MSVAPGRPSTVAPRAAAGLVALLVVVACTKPPPGRVEVEQRCEACHPDQASRLARSRHARALGKLDRLPAGPLAGGFRVLDGGAWLVGPLPDGGQLGGRLAGTLGVSPLVQLAVEVAPGTLQVPPVARDSADGGWFLVPLEAGAAGDWSAPAFSWNGSCAPCHATGFVVGPRDDGGFASTWGEEGVGCSGCHGDARGHLAWLARGRDGGTSAGYAASLREARPFTFTAGEAIARASGASPADAQFGACAACHARRRPLTDDGAVGALLDLYEPALLQPGLYFADGQVRDEVFEAPSFLASRMHAHGVRCTHCHDPHGGGQRAEGNALCAHCHASDHYDGPAHRGHAGADAGTACVDCHMPVATFLGRDARRDHLFPVPDPVRSAALGSPDPCRGCHPSQAPQALARAIQGWIWLRAAALPGGAPGGDALTPRVASPSDAGDARPGARGDGGLGATAEAVRPVRSQDHAEAFAAAFRREAGARRLLLAAADDPQAAPWVRASALALLADAPGPGAAQRLAAAARSDSDWLRYGAATGLQGLSPQARAAAGAPLLADARRAVRVRAARALAGAPEQFLLEPAREQFARALVEAERAERANAFRGDAFLNLGALAAARGDAPRSEEALRRGLALDRSFAPLAINLADLLRATGRDAEGEAVLRSAMGIPPWEGDVDHALALWMVRAGRREQALSLFARAARGSARFTHTWLVALDGLGRKPEARRGLRAARAEFPRDGPLLLLEATWARDEGAAARARAAARALLALDPDDPDAHALLGTGP